MPTSSAGRRLASMAVLLVLVVAGAVLGPWAASRATAAPKDYTVGMSSQLVKGKRVGIYTPVRLTVKVGDRVNWANREPVPSDYCQPVGAFNCNHNVTASSPGWPTRDGKYSQDALFVAADKTTDYVTFTKPGLYTYYDRFHYDTKTKQGMTGEICVDPCTTATSAPPPQDDSSRPPPQDDDPSQPPPSGGSGGSGGSGSGGSGSGGSGSGGSGGSGSGGSGSGGTSAGGAPPPPSGSQAPPPGGSGSAGGPAIGPGVAPVTPTTPPPGAPPPSVAADGGEAAEELPQAAGSTPPTVNLGFGIEGPGDGGRGRGLPVALAVTLLAGVASAQVRTLLAIPLEQRR